MGPIALTAEFDKYFGFTAQLPGGADDMHLTKSNHWMYDIPSLENNWLNINLGMSIYSALRLFSRENSIQGLQKHLNKNYCIRRTKKTA